MDPKTRMLLVDVAVGLSAGLVATKVYGYAQQAFYRPMPRHVRWQEERVRPAPSSQIAAEKTAESLGYSLDERERKLAGCAVHYGLGAAWGPIYSLLRRHGGIQPLGAAVLTGASLSLIVNEGLTPRSRTQRPEPGLPGRNPYPRLPEPSGLWGCCGC
jgi:hypothetical protein